MKFFEKLANKIKLRFKNLVSRIKAYFKKLLFPLYLFPIKLLTYSTYYLLKFIIKFLFAFIGLIKDCIIFPFKSLKNFLISVVIFGVVLYLITSLFVIGDYLTKQYGWWGKYLCSFGTRQKIEKSVVRIVGGYSEGSGFFIFDDTVITNYHVIEGEPSPKIIFSDGTFTTPIKILGNPDFDLALLYTQEKYPDYVFPVMAWTSTLPIEKPLSKDEPVLASGYALGTNLVGGVSIVKGNYIDLRQSRSDVVSYMQTNISLVEGMSGGPLTDQCGVVIGVNTLGVSGMSFFISGFDINELIKQDLFTDTNITKIQVDPSASPEEAVRAFYTYLMARRMQDGFNLLSKEYLQKTNFEEWTARFKDIIDVGIYKSEKYENSKDTVFVKFLTKNWVDGEVEYHYYEGTWQTIEEDGVYKMLKSKITEVEEPDWDWFYE